MDCAICFDTCNANDMKLGCGHTFHSGCISNWASRGHNTCPLCRNHFIVEQDPGPESPPMLYLNASVSELRAKFAQLEDKISELQGNLTLFRKQPAMSWAVQRVTSVMARYEQERNGVLDTIYTLIRGA